MRKYRLFVALLGVLAVTGCTEGSLENEHGGENNVPLCGNGKLEEGEQCDDGNTDALDGCSANCEIEVSDTCDNGECEPEVKHRCGDGQKTGDEACDDGNAHAGDGCSADCKAVEDGFECPKPGSACVPLVICGDGEMADNEVCDDGNNTAGDGCSADCMTVESGYVCEKPGYACRLETCGDGILDDGEACDNGTDNIAYAVMDGFCGIDCQPAHYCGDGKLDQVDRDNGEECDADFDMNAYKTCMMCTFFNDCGDGKRTHEEGCDDGNTNDGDGCSSACIKETGFLCTENSDGLSECREILCGNGKLDAEAGELCDDGNRVAGDGCSASCLIEKGWLCTTEDGSLRCTRACGNGIVEEAANELCDDGNDIDGDGCSSQCQIEAGYTCELGAAGSSVCMSRACGDGIKTVDEDCDDGNTVSRDGCSQRCVRETGWHCPTQGQPCYLSQCGNGVVEGDERCDEGGNTTAGCVHCVIQPGWQCLLEGQACTNDAICGNGQLEGAESCDEGGNTTAGCVNCVIQSGWRCTTVGAACVQGSCGDGVLDTGEECDDGNSTAGDGCSPLCETEPIFECKDGVCKPTCGDGLTLTEAGEECDDGNLVSGDGCSAQCKREAGYVCNVQGSTNSNPKEILLPIVYRDFVKWSGSTKKPDGTDGYVSQALYNSLPDSCKGTNNGYRRDYPLTAGMPSPDFNSYCPASRCVGAVQATLDSDGKPALSPSNEIKAWSGSGAVEEITCRYLYTCPEVFKWWYQDIPGLNRTIKTTLKLTRSGDNYAYSSSSFLPLQDVPASQYYASNGQGEFTSEFQTYFKYKGGEQLIFNGDDDVWVFFNGHLGVDVGGIHPAWERSITLDTKTAAEKFHMFPGGIYSLNMFHAERCLGGSSFRLTLAGFVSMGTSTCTSVCGDGIVRGSEECDYEGNPNDPELNKKYGCTACKLTPHCGNGKVEAGEGCDTTESWCVNCKISTCGNSTFEPEHEQCDLSAPASGTNRHENCLDTCRISGCGDGFVDTARGEQCDDGNTSDDDMCTSLCEEPRCGDGIVTPSLGEACDDGKNDGSYGGCGLGCAYITPFCGDGTIDKLNGEECDDGDGNVGGYGACGKDCKYTEYCGDGIIQSAYEVCDEGENNGKGTCSNHCTIAVN